MTEKCENYKAAYRSVEREFKKNVKVTKIANTNMDKAIQKNKDMENFGKADLSIFLPEEERKFYYWETDKYLDEPEEELYLWETDRKIAEELKKCGCG